MSDNLTSTSAKRMLGYCPWYYETSRVFQSYLQAVGVELDSIKQGAEESLNQFFIPTATWGIEQWEEELGLESYTGKPIEQRKSRVISKIRGIGTVTVRLVELVSEAYGYGNVEIINHPNLYSFTVKFVDPYGVPPNLDDLKQVIEEIKPAHLKVEYEFTYVTYGEIKGWGLTYGQLKAMTYEQMRSYKRKAVS